MDNIKTCIQSIIQNLQDAGCNDCCISDFVKVYESDDIDEQLRILTKHRRCLLDKVHEENKRIDCLDYLIYQIRTMKDKKDKESVYEESCCCINESTSGK